MRTLSTSVIEVRDRLEGPPVPIRRFSVLLALLPVTASFIGWIWLDQTPSWLEVAGIALVLVGVAVQQRDEIDRVERTVRTDPA